MALSVWGDTLRIELSLSMSSASSACGPCAGLIRRYESALRLLETVLPHDHPDLVKVLADLPAAYRARGRGGDAEKVLREHRARVRAIRSASRSANGSSLAFDRWHAKRRSNPHRQARQRIMTHLADRLLHPPAADQPASGQGPLASIAGLSIPPFTLVLALIFALALSALSSPQLDALPPALCAPT